MTTKKNLKKGSKGKEVKQLQEQLNKIMKPSPNLETDGKFGKATTKAVKGFQKNPGRKPTVSWAPALMPHSSRVVDPKARKLPRKPRKSLWIQP